MTNEQKLLQRATEAYIKAFEKLTELEFEYESGEVYCFGEFYFNFSDIVKVVDLQIPFEVVSDWYWFMSNYDFKINLENYFRLDRDFRSALHEAIEFDCRDFQLKLMNDRLKSFGK